MNFRRIIFGVIIGILSAAALFMIFGLLLLQGDVFQDGPHPWALFLDVVYGIPVLIAIYVISRLIRFLLKQIKTL